MYRPLYITITLIFSVSNVTGQNKVAEFDLAIKG